MATLAEAFGQVIATILKALISGLFKGVLSPLLGNIAGVTDVDGHGIAADLDGFYGRYVAPHMSPWPAHSPVTPGEAASEAYKVFSDYMDLTRNVNLAHVVVEAASLGQVEAVGYNADRLLAVANIQAVTNQIVKTEFDAKLLTWLRYYYNQFYEPMIPPVDVIADMYLKGWVDPGTAATHMNWQGLSGQYISAYLNMAAKRPDIAALTKMLYRKQIDEAGFKKGLKMLGIPEADHGRYLALTEWIPPIEDLRLMAVREAFPVEPGPPQYEELYKWGSLHGLSRYWVDRYLYMGFIRMDPRLAMDYFLYRHYMPDEYEAWLRIADIHPDDRPPLVEVAFRPPTLYQARRGWEAGIYADEDLIRFNRWRGMNPTDAETAAFSDFEWVLRADRGELERQIEREYLAGYGTIEQAKTDLEAIGFSAKRIDLRLAYYSERAAFDHNQELVTLYREAYRKDLINDVELRANLEYLEIRDDVIDLIMDREYVRKYVKPKEPTPEKIPVLTLAQLFAAFRLDIIIEDQVREELARRLYSPEDIETLITTEKEKMAA